MKKNKNDLGFDNIYIGDVESVDDWIKLKEKGYIGVSGDFDCSGEDLASLRGGPEYVGGDFYCYDNKITTLDFCPKYIGGIFDCSDNKISRLTLEEFDGVNVEGCLFCSGNYNSIEKFSAKPFNKVIDELKEVEENKVLKKTINKNYKEGNLSNKVYLKL